ncbi:hypothetical protein EST38_g9111 [Candolleomyces aberdarensis]|uniref:pyranose dehydrogenase (acceptor) n=1 Tax=Candolleomyces aberdarensis TaxID=2316362 RepID=A0A4Q2DDM3_9AGAR|nr:hypothetical protein EST38_g9111 [Candolleomyces aberdarensis]
MEDSPFIFELAGGTAGSVVASRLSENSQHNVLLLEAGPNNEGILELIVPGLHIQIPNTYDWNYTTVPQAMVNNRSFDYRRGFVLGGSSSVNSMLYTRGSKDDYDLWGRVSGDPKTWSWEALQKWILKSEKWTGPVGGRDPTGQYDPQYHGTDGPIRVSLTGSGPDDFDRRASRNTELQKEFVEKLDSNDGSPPGLCAYTIFLPDENIEKAFLKAWIQWTFGGGERNSAATGYLGSRTRARPNLSIVLNVHVKKVIPSTQDGKGSLEMRTVEIGSKSSNLTLRVTARKEAILSAGAFGTPHILLNSGIGEESHLNSVGVKTVHNLPDVGRGMSDHVSAIVTYTSNATTPAVDEEAALRQWQTNRTGPFAEWRQVGRRILWSKIPKSSPILSEYGDPASGPNSPHLEIPLGPAGPTMAVSVVLLTPYSRGTVKLASSNPFDDPLIDPGYLSHPFDIQALKEGIRVTKRWFDSPAWDGLITGFLGPDPDNATLSETVFQNALKESVGSFLHPVGTAAMSASSSAAGVVDHELKVKGVHGLRVVDASAIPYVPTAHTQAAVYVLAERAADIIESSWK